MKNKNSEVIQQIIQKGMKDILNVQIQNANHDKIKACVDHMRYIEEKDTAVILDNFVVLHLDENGELCVRGTKDISYSELVKDFSHILSFNEQLNFGETAIVLSGLDREYSEKNQDNGVVN